MPLKISGPDGQGLLTKNNMVFVKSETVDFKDSEILGLGSNLLGYLKAFWPEICGLVLGVWAGPHGGFKPIQEVGGTRLH